jgi:hypothetical protein
MNPTHIILLILGTPIALLVLTVLAIAWVADGESDVNGDPERDAGQTEDEIEARSRAWDRGSDATSSAPNLEYARRLNKEAMRHLIHN